MSRKKLFFILFLLMCQLAWTQKTVVVLDAVLVSDSQLKKFTNTKSKQVLNDSIIQKNQASLTSLLNFNSVISFKENGLGMVSSPTFRGSTAQQTAVVWNGININSQLNGQTDFNTITTRDFNSITIQSGGSSAIYGSSAIGGSIHLNNTLRFKQLFFNELNTNYGSFNTFGINYKTAFANEKLSTQISISRNSSTNDYEYIGNEYSNEIVKNQNGQYYNTSMNASLGYKFDNSNSLKIYSQFYDSERHFSPSFGAVSNSKYQDLNTRNLIEYENNYCDFTSKIKVAYLTERYKYFDNYNNPNFLGSTAETFIAKYDLNYKLGKNTEINTIFDITKTKAFGNSIGENSRQIGSAIVLFKTLFFNKLLFESSLRKEQSNVYKSPFLYAFGLKFNANNHYNCKINVSKNFRIPTFNDLYWNGSGNLDLKPETSKQLELINEFDLKNFKLTATTYYSETENLIQWTPIYSNWSPKNVGSTTNYGIEIYTKFKHHFGKNQFEINSNYAFTKAKDNETNLVLIYVPKHKINGELVYKNKKFTANYQYLFNGYVFTSTDNFYYLKEYQLSNIGLNYTLEKKNNCNFGFQILNVWNKNYETVSARPMPRRNFNININFKF